MTQSPDAEKTITHQEDCILFGIWRLSSLHMLGLPNSGPATDNGEDQGRIWIMLKNNQRMQIHMFWEPKFESWPHFPLLFSCTLLKRSVVPNLVPWPPLLLRPLPLQSPAWTHTSVCDKVTELRAVASPEALASVAAPPGVGRLLLEGSMSHPFLTYLLRSWPFVSSSQVMVPNTNAATGTPCTQSLCLLLHVRVSAAPSSTPEVHILCDNPCYSILCFCQSPLFPSHISCCLEQLCIPCARSYLNLQSHHNSCIFHIITEL